MNEIIKFLKKRRSVTAKKMLPGKVTESDLNDILECALRVPDHEEERPGAAAPGVVPLRVAGRRTAHAPYSALPAWPPPPDRARRIQALREVILENLRDLIPTK